MRLMSDKTDTTRDASLVLYSRLLDAWNRRDATGFAALFSPHGIAIGFDGSQMEGPADIEQQLQAVFANHPTARYVAKVREVRRIEVMTTIVRAVAGMVPPGESRINPRTNAVQTLVVTLDAGQWRIALMQNTPAAFHQRPELADALTAELTAVHESGALVEE
jgi:uncharacterized protein (TIGR02246 family)